MNGSKKTNLVNNNSDVGLRSSTDGERKYYGANYNPSGGGEKYGDGNDIKVEILVEGFEEPKNKGSRSEIIRPELFPN